MATTTGITKEAAEAILGKSVVAGTVNPSGHLILTRADASTFDAGDFNTVIENLIESSLGVAAAFKNTTTGTVAPDQIPSIINGYNAQTAPLMEFRRFDGTLLAKIGPAGTLTVPAILGATIDGASNNLTNINAVKLQGHPVTVGPTAPASPAVGDIWIQTGA
jgi:hypothetical protein